MQLSDFGCCWRCGLPQRLCDGWAGEECADIDKMIPVLILIGEDEGLKRVMDKEFGREMIKEVGYVEWIGRSRRMVIEKQQPDKKDEAVVNEELKDLWKQLEWGKGQCASCVRYERTNTEHELFRCGNSRDKQRRKSIRH
jgi:hypothetical protein